MNLFDELRLAETHVKNCLSQEVSFIEPYRSLLKSCFSVLSVVRKAYSLPSLLPKVEDDLDWLKGFDTDLSHGVSSTHIDI